MSKFQELVESQVNADSLNEGLRSAINNSKVGSSINRFGSGVADASSYLVSKARHLTGLSTKSSTSQLEGAVNHINLYSEGKDVVKHVSDIVVKNPKSSEEHLGSVIRKSPDPEHALAAIAHPNATTKNVLSAIINHRDSGKVLTAAINHPKIDKNTLDFAARRVTNTDNPEATQALVNHEKISGESLAHLVNHTDPRRMSASLIDKIANHPNANRDTNDAIANHRDTSTHTLRQLANKDISHDTARSIVRHENTDPATIHHLVTKESNNVESGNAHPYRGVSSSAVRNPNTSPETLSHIAANLSSHSDVKYNQLRALVAHPRTPSSALRTIYDNHPSFREDAMAHPNGGTLRKFALPKG